ncbi:helix-turn-helix domain-containing protein [Nonomuraea sp. NPDC050153]|uniref:helix-turn-helix domain-containing protein n=1 Tax=Nonomuraea sp. NPDC050153 TaxID=3364359 RepID=UPI0037A205B2
MSDNAPARPFLDLIEATLNRQGKTKAWLAQRSKVNRNTINNWGTQPRTPQAANVIAVAEALNIEQDRALRLAGLRTDMPRAEGEALALAAIPTDDLLAEIRRRIPD